MIINAGERIDELHRNGYQIIQKTDGFCFGMDAVLLSGFAAVKDGENALCYPPEDVDALADRIRTLLEQPDRRAEIGRKAAEEIRQHLNEKKMAAEIETFINKILEKK